MPRPPCVKQMLGFVPAHLFNSSIREDKKRIRDGTAEMQKLPTEKRLEIDGRIIDAVSGVLCPDQPRGSPQYHEAASRVLKEEGLSSTGGVLVAAAAKLRSPERVVPMSYLTRLEGKKGGYHLHLPGSVIPIAVLAENPLTRIRFVEVAETKYSTLFPDGTNEEDVIRMANFSPKIMEQDNRCLRMTAHGFVIECYKRSAIEYSSIFPAYSYHVVEAGDRYRLTESIAVSSDRVLEAAIAVIREKHSKGSDPFSYAIEIGGTIGDVIMDLAEAFFPETNVNKGVLFRFSRLETPELFAVIDSLYGP